MGRGGSTSEESPTTNNQQPQQLRSHKLIVNSTLRNRYCNKYDR